jgi:hypothetical protein
MPNLALGGGEEMHQKGKPLEEGHSWKLIFHVELNIDKLI